MKKSLLLSTACACVISFISLSSFAAGVPGQGTWETTLLPRSLDGDNTTAEAYYDTVLGITWLEDTNYAATQYINSGGLEGDSDGLMTWFDTGLWATSLDINGITGWRLPTANPVNGSTYQNSWSTNATSDVGYAPTTTDGMDGGWRDSFGNPVSEMGHMFYVILGNLGLCTPDNSTDWRNCVEQSGWGLTNTGPFLNFPDPEVELLLQYWTGSRHSIDLVARFAFYWGLQDFDALDELNEHYAWAVHDGDVGQAVIPIPAAIWLFSTGLLGLVGIARRRSNTSLTIKRQQHLSRSHSPLRGLFHRNSGMH